MRGIMLGADFLSTYEEGIKREWIIGNGLGGYVSSTVIKQNEAGNQVKDPAIRPNQIFAVSLPYTMLSPEKEKAIWTEWKKTF
jgi:glycogen debranching enzyme